MYLFKIMNILLVEVWRTAVVQYYLDTLKEKMESHSECICNTKTPLHSHNVFAVRNYARLVKERLDYIIQQCCFCQWLENT